MTPKRFFPFLLLLFAFSLSGFGQNLNVRQIMSEPSLAGMRPESQRLSPDGRLVVFSWNSAGKEPRNLYLTLSRGGSPQMIVDAEKNYEVRADAPESKLNYGLNVRDEFVRAREKNLGGAAFSPNSKRLLFTQNGDIYVLEISEGTNSVAPAVSRPRRITRTQGAEFAARWLDDQTILYQSGGNFFALNIEQTSLVQLSREANPQAFISVSQATPTEDARFFAYAVSDTSKQRGLIVPNYLGEFVAAPTFRRGFSEQTVKIVKTDGSLERPIDVNLPKSEGATYLRSLQWLADGKRLVIDRVDKDTKRRQIFLATVGENNRAEVVLVDEESDPKWIGSLSRTIEPHPKNSNQFFFTSERDGWNHIYLATLDAAKFKDGRANPTIRQLTRGNFEIGWAKWRSNGEHIVYTSTEKNAAEREIFAFDLRGNKGVALMLGSEGMKTGAQLSEKGGEDILLYEFSRWDQPTEIYATRICPECRGLSTPVRLTNSIPETFRQGKWSAPRFVSFKAKDGKTIPAKVYVPENFNKNQKYPMVVFVHGAGYLQNVINGWNNYYREFMFHTLLTEKGYVVLDIDYRGSAGYGRDFRTDVYDFLGGADYQDHLDGIDFAVANYGVDAKRVGVYGGSYGGFMAGMLVMRAPEKIAAAAALRPVFDWKNYFYSSPVYTTERLGFPDKNPEAYRRSSPIAYADKLQKPLLILHGLVDDNVPAQDSIQLVEKLMRLEKTEYFELMIYPAENHGFTRPSSWADEYERILAFFEKHLK